MSKIKKFYKKLDAVFQPLENVVDTVWQGETDKDKKKRLAQEAKDAKAAAIRRDKNVKIVLVVLGISAAAGIYFFFFRKR
jgi:hypothetical protein